MNLVSQHARGARADRNVQVLFCVDADEPDLHAAAAQVREQSRRDHGVGGLAGEAVGDEALHEGGQVRGGALVLDLFQGDL